MKVANQLTINPSASGLVSVEEFQDLLDQGYHTTGKLLDIYMRHLGKATYSESSFDLEFERVKRIAWKAIERVFRSTKEQIVAIMNEEKGQGSKSQAQLGNTAKLAIDAIRLDGMTHQIYLDFLAKIPKYYFPEYPHINPIYNQK